MIKLADPCLPEKAIEESRKVLQSGNLVQGKYVSQFEKDLTDYLGIKQVIVVSSGTAALHLSLMALDIKKGDEVIVPAFTFPATANAVELGGARPVFVDILLDDFCIDPSLVESKITKKTKAIIPVHEFGQSADISRLLDIAERHKIHIIEDAACALGTECENKKAGTFGILGCFSFHPRKAITTGEGGAIVTNNDHLAEKMRSIRNHGIIINNSKYDFAYAGINYRMTDFQAALGICQLEEIEKDISKRIKISEEYGSYLETTDWLKRPPILKHRKNVYQTYHMMASDSVNRDELILYLRNGGIETNLGAYALHCLSFYKTKYNYKTGDYPNSEKAYKQGIALPIGRHLSDENIEYIAETISNYCQ